MFLFQIHFLYLILLYSEKRHLSIGAIQNNIMLIKYVRYVQMVPARLVRVAKTTAKKGDRFLVSLFGF